MTLSFNLTIVCPTKFSQLAALAIAGSAADGSSQKPFSRGEATEIVAEARRIGHLHADFSAVLASLV
jgi:hypothetical protein